MPRDMRALQILGAVARGNAALAPGRFGCGKEVPAIVP
jgi:vacuolar-type H+-ATPase catalytic subunit A/Vma1